MNTFHTHTSTSLAGGLALGLIALGAFAAAPPADPDPTSKGTPMEDANVPNTQSTTPYSSSASSTGSSATSSDMSSQTIGMQSKFDQLDVNHDGYIDKQEAAADSKLAKQFAKLDTNKDVKLSITEFSSAKGLAMNKKASTKPNNKNSTQDQYQQ